MGEKLCPNCITQGKDICPVPEQLRSLQERSGLRDIPPVKPGLDPELFSPAQKEQQGIIAAAIEKSCPYVSKSMEILKGNKR